MVLLSSASVVYLNADSNPIAARHLTVERALIESGLPSTFVRPGYFATNTLRWTSIRSRRVVRTAFPEGRTSTVHEHDIADVAVHMLTHGPSDRQAYPVLVPGLSTVREQVAAIADAIGEPIRLEQVDVDTFRREQITQLPEPIVDILISARGDVPDPPAKLAVDAVPELPGRPALPFAQWARDHAGDFRRTEFRQWLRGPSQRRYWAIVPTIRRRA